MNEINDRRNPPAVFTDPLAGWWPRGRMLILILIILTCVWLFDYVTGIEFRVIILYLIPIMMTAWYVGRAESVAVVLMSMTGWIVFEIMGGRQYEQPVAWAWNFMITGGTMALFAFVTSRMRRLVAQLRREAMHDALTGLLNVRAFNQRARETLEICRRGNRAISLAFFDLDNFKTVNDTHGHAAGDELLAVIGRALAIQMRASDVVGRLGGDEFALVLPDTGADGARRAVEKLQARLAEEVGRRDYPVTISIGLVTWAAASGDLDAMIHEADAAMYEIKLGGKNGIRQVVH